MDTRVCGDCSTAISPSPEKKLQSNLSILSKSMPSPLVEDIAWCLRRSGTITEYALQEVRSKTTDTQRASHLVLIVLRKGRTACLRFYECLSICNPELFVKITRCPVKLPQEDHYHQEYHSQPKGEVSLPTYSITIQNSTLKNCIIGHNNGQHAGCDCHCLLSQSEANAVGGTELVARLQNDQKMAVQDSSKALSLHVDSSHLKYTIIGNDSTMIIRGSLDTEEVEDEDNAEDGDIDEENKHTNMRG